MYIVFAIIAFSLLIIIHELGHFLLAKLNGVKVYEFSIGMGPKLFSIKGKETEYMIKVFPVGGYVKMEGEETESDDPRSFSRKKPIQRILIVAAGAFMNYILAIFLFSIISYNFGFTKPVLSDVLPKSPALEAGLKNGDEIIKINDKKIYTSDDVRFEIALSKGNPINLQYKRNEETFNKTIVPMKDENGTLIIGINFETVENPTIFESVNHSMKETVTLVSQSITALKSIFTGKANLKTDIGGPVTIVKMSGAAAKAGIWNLIWFTAFLSVQLAVFNLLPFPALDGGWIIILFIEMITRRKIPQKVINAINYVGFLALMALMLLVTIKDIIFPVKL